MKVKFLNAAWLSLKNTALKFPAFFLGTMVATVTSTLATCYSGKYGDSCSRISACAFWCCSASFFFELLCRLVCQKKNIQGKKETLLHLLSQILSLLLSVPMYFILKAESDYSLFIYGSTFFVFVASGVYLLYYFQNEEAVVPNATVSLIMEGITVTCVISGLFLIIFAFQKLIYDFSSSTPYVFCAFFASFIIGLNLLVSYVTRPRDVAKAPKAFNVIVCCALLPIYASLVAVLYVYFAKCIFTSSMPSGMVNPFVSAATAVYLYFYLSLPKGGSFSVAGNFLRKWGSLFLFPLIALQIFAFCIRAGEYGFTCTRVASLYYIVSSVIFCVLPFIKDGAYMKMVCILFSAFALLMSLPLTGCISITKFSQNGRIVRIYKAHSLFEDGKLKAAGAGSVFSEEEKARVVSAFDELEKFKKKPSWWVGEEFSKITGLEYSKKYNAKKELKFFNSLNLRHNQSEPLNISEFSILYSFYESHYKYSKEKTGGIINFAESQKLDFTDELKEYLLSNSAKTSDSDLPEAKEGILTLKKDGWTVIFTRLELILNEGEAEFSQFVAEGFVCK